MNTKTQPYVFFLLCCTLLIPFSCGDSTTEEENEDQFDRSALLADYAEGFIVPGYESYTLRLEELKTATSQFIDNPSTEHLRVAQESSVAATVAWQYVEMFEIGKAEELSLRNFTNIYPVDVDAIEQNIAEQNFTFNLPSKYDEQGLQAIDYLLFAGTDDEILASFQTDPKRAEYLQNLVDRLNSMAREVFTDWTNEGATNFIANSGSSATSSLNKLVNDLVFYYEKFLRAGKVGIPAGVFSGDALPTTTEGYYSREYSKEFLSTALRNFQAFFNGERPDGGAASTSLAAYLDYLRNLNGTEDLATAINEQLDLAEQKIAVLDANLSFQVKEENSKMLEAYDELQKVVVLLKVDMMQAMNIRVDFIDADGD